MGIIFGEVVNDISSASCDNESSESTDNSQELQHSINEKVITLVWIACISFCLIYIYIVCWAIFSRRLETRIRDRYFHMVLRQDATFFDKRQAGEISSRLNADIQTIQSGTSEKVGICMACTSFFLTAYVVAFIKDTKLAGMLVSLVPAFLLLAAVASAFTQKFTARASDSIASASSIAQETLSHIAVVQAFGAGPRLEKIFASRMTQAQKFGIKKAFVAALQAGMLYFIAYSANALSYWQGSKQIVESMNKEGGITIGAIYTVIFLLVDGKLYSDPLVELGLMYNSLCLFWINRSSVATHWCSGRLIPQIASRY